MRRKLLAIAIAFLPPSVAQAQDSGWSRLGEAIAHRESPAVDIVATSLTGHEANRAYTDCLESRINDFAQSDQNAYAIASAAKGACSNARQVFYSAVYNDMRQDSGKNASVRAANSVIASYDADVDNRLPGLAITAKRGAPPAADRYDRVEKLKALLERGALTQTEFDAEKAKVLAEGTAP